MASSQAQISQASQQHPQIQHHKMSPSQQAISHPQFYPPVSMSIQQSQFQNQIPPYLRSTSGNNVIPYIAPAYSENINNASYPIQQEVYVQQPQLTNMQPSPQHFQLPPQHQQTIVSDQVNVKTSRHSSLRPSQGFEQQFYSQTGHTVDHPAYKYMAPNIKTEHEATPYRYGQSIQYGQNQNNNGTNGSNTDVSWGIHGSVTSMASKSTAVGDANLWEVAELVGNKVMHGFDVIGEKVADFLGITQPRYGEYSNEAHKYKKAMQDDVHRMRAQKTAQTLRSELEKRNQSDMYYGNNGRHQSVSYYSGSQPQQSIRNSTIGSLVSSLPTIPAPWSNKAAKKHDASEIV